MTIERIQVSKRMSQAVVYGETVYLAGQVALDSAGAPAGQQMEEILGRIDALLGEVGSDKSKILSATIWLADIRDYDAVNKPWDAWLTEGNAPARACVEAKLASPEFTVEVGVIAAR